MKSLKHTNALLKELCSGEKIGKVSKHPKRNSPNGGSLEAVKLLNTKIQKHLY